MRNEKPLLSVIVTAHNCDSYLQNTLESLNHSIGEAFQSVEIIIVDDSSTDKTPEIISFFHAKSDVNKYNVSYRNIGKVRNFGVSKARGDYITMLDGDDQLLPNSISDIINHLESSLPDILLSRLNEVRSNDTREIEWKGVRAKTFSQHYAIKTYLNHKKMQAHFIGQFIKARILKNNPFPDYQCYEDAFLFPTILKHSGKIFFLDNGPYLYMKRAGSLSSTINIEKVNLLISTIEKMELEFGDRYKNLIACHWIDLELKYGSKLKNELCHSVVLKKLSGIDMLSFMFDFSVRTSFKKKLIKLKLAGL